MGRWDHRERPRPAAARIARARRVRGVPPGLHVAGVRFRRAARGARRRRPARTVGAGVVQSPLAKAATAALVLLAAAGIGNAVGWYAGAHARTRAKATRFGQADAVAGSHGRRRRLAARDLVPRAQPRQRPVPEGLGADPGSAVVRALDAALPRTTLAAGPGAARLDGSGSPTSSRGSRRLPADPVEPPTQAEARAAVEAADEHGPGDRRGLRPDPGGVGVRRGRRARGDERARRGRAWTTRGSSSPAARLERGEDRAVRRRPGPRGPARLTARRAAPLALATGTIDRGRGARSSAIRAAGRSDARRGGRAADDGGGRPRHLRHGQVERRVLELQTMVQPGNSGGPFVLSTGRWAGSCSRRRRATTRSATRSR